jgi:uncharacterized membrane protein
MSNYDGSSPGFQDKNSRLGKYEFMARLKKRLRKLPKDEYNDAVEYYEQYFEESGENESECVARLGSPDAVAAKIFADYVRKPTKGNPWNKVWIIILAVFASPIALPLAIAFFVFALALFIFIFALAAAGAVVILGGVAAAVLSLKFIISDFASTMFFVGIGLMCLSVGAAVLSLAAKLIKKGVGRLRKFFGRIFFGRYAE